MYALLQRIRAWQWVEDATIIGVAFFVFTANGDIAIVALQHQGIVAKSAITMEESRCNTKYGHDMCTLQKCLRRCNTSRGNHIIGQGVAIA